MSDDLFGVYRSRAMAREYDRSLQQWEEHSEQLKQENERLSKINQQNLYYLGSALGAANEERLSRYALLAYIGSLFLVLNKKFGKESVRQMLSLDTPEMVKALNEKLSMVEGWIKEEGTLPFLPVTTVGTLKNPHIRRGYDEVIEMYKYGDSSRKTITSLNTNNIGHEIQKEAIRPMLEGVQRHHWS